MIHAANIKKKLMKKQLDKATRRQAKDFYKRVTPAMDFLENVMKKATDEEAQSLAIYMCSEIISGFEDKNDKEFIYKSLGVTLENIENGNEDSN